MKFGCTDFIFIVFKSSPWTVVSCLTKERPKVEYMLSSQTNLSLSTFTVKWVQVSEITAILSLRKSIKTLSVFRGSDMGRWAGNKTYKLIKKDSYSNTEYTKRADKGVEVPFTSSALRILPDPCVNLLCGLCIRSMTMFLINSIDGGSTVIQRRVDGSVDFDQTWNKYEKGFGDLESRFLFFLIKIIYKRLFSYL